MGSSGTSPDELDGFEHEQVNADGTVIRISIQRTDGSEYPSGWRYTMHYGLQGQEDTPLLRYDNSHEREKGHERHTIDETEVIQFPGIAELFDRFMSEYDTMRG